MIRPVTATTLGGRHRRVDRRTGARRHRPRRRRAQASARRLGRPPPARDGRDRRRPNRAAPARAATPGGTPGRPPPRRALSRPSLHRLDPWPDSPAALGRLRELRTVAALSNADLPELADLSAHGGLAWHAVLSASSVRAYKPAPAVYDMALEQLGVAPEQAMLVAAHPWTCAARPPAATAPPTSPARGPCDPPRTTGSTSRPRICTRSPTSWPELQRQRSTCRWRCSYPRL